jgi:hypothetical protein
MSNSDEQHPITAALDRLGDWLAERDIIGENNPGTIVRPPEELALELWAWAVAADHPDDGTRLYAYDGVSPDGIVATRMRGDGQWEHSVLDEDGMPIEWRLVYKPQFN